MDSPRGRTHPGDGLAMALVVVLVVAAVAGGVLASQARDDRASAAAVQQRYGDVQAAASAEAEAFVNLRYDDVQAGLDQVAQGATGELLEQYTSSSDRVEAKLRKKQSVMEGEVRYVGVVSLDQERATVLAATTGTVATKQTDNQPIGQDFRLRLELELVDGRWLTSTLEIVD